MSPTFVHLRVHSEYSLSDGMVRIKPLAEATAEMHMPAVAITDINNLYALIKFYNATSNAGVKPIVAADVWVVSEGDKAEPTPLVLLARNNSGYRNLSELISRAYLEGQTQGKAQLQYSWIAEQCDGLIALSAGRNGDVGRLLLSNKVAEAKACAQRWMEIFPDSYYLELHRTGRDGEEEYIHRAVGTSTGD